MSDTPDTVTLTFLRPEAEWLAEEAEREGAEIDEHDWSLLHHRLRAALDNPQPSDTGLSIPVAVAPEIAADSWLNDDEYEDFRRAYGYARNQSAAIEALARITPEQAYSLYYIFRLCVEREQPDTGRYEEALRERLLSDEAVEALADCIWSGMPVPRPTILNGARIGLEAVAAALQPGEKHGN